MNDITLRHVCKSYTTQSTDIMIDHAQPPTRTRQVLRDVNVTFPLGKLTVLVGRSGCGKSTLLRLLSGQDQPDSGEIEIPEGWHSAVLSPDPYVITWTSVLRNVAMACGVGSAKYATFASQGFGANLRQCLFDKVQEFSFADIDRFSSASLITRMTSDINQVQSGLNLFLRLFLRSPFVVFGAMIMAFAVNVRAAWIFVVAIPLLSIVVFGVMVLTNPLYKTAQTRLDRVLGLTRENLTGVRVVRAFDKEKSEIDRFESANDLLTKMQLHVGHISSLMSPLTYVIINLAIVALLYVGSIEINIGGMASGDVIALVNYMNQILVELVKLANLIVTMTKALACAERVASVFDIGADAAYVGAQNQKLADKVDKSAPFLDFKHVSLTYQGAGAPTLQDMNFTVNRGDTVGIIGGTGSGKTSLVNLIPGFYPATEGEILLEGRDIRTMSDEELRGRIGVVPQKAVLFKGTIRSNLQWGKPDATEVEMWKALELAQASEVVDGKPGKLDATVAQNGKNFSGGQRQRLTIARALVRNPEILILDDSASALDYATDAKLRAALRTLEDKTTTFIVSQRASTIRHADKIIVLDDGEIAGMGTHDELLKDCTVYQEIYYSQYPEQRGGVR